MSLNLLSLLNPCANSFDSRKFTTAQSSIHPSDVAAAISYGHFTPWEEHYIYAKFCHVEKSIMMFWRASTGRIMQDARENAWNIPNEKIPFLALILLHESMFSHDCSRCEGSGLKNDIENCPSCHGFGIKLVSSRQQESLTHISKSNWCRYWRKRMNIYLAETLQIEANLNQILHSQIHRLKASNQ